MADYKATAAELASIANAIRLKGGTSVALGYPSEWITAIANLVPASGGSEITPLDPTVEYKVTDTDLASIANAIRTRGGTSAQLEFPTGFVTAINNIPGGGGASWATGTDAEVAAMIDAAQNGEIDLQQDGGWAVGDVRTIVVDAFVGGGNKAHVQQSIDIVITSFDEYDSSGNVLQFDFKDALLEPQRMNSTNSNSYSTSEMKTVTLPALVSALPSWLSSRLVEFSGQKLSIRNSDEISNLSYYTQSTMVKTYGHNGSDAVWWVRDKSGSDRYYVVTTSGSYYYYKAATEQGLAPFGCL